MPNIQLESARRVGWGRRLSYAFIGLVAGNAAMDLFLLICNLPALVHSWSAHQIPKQDILWTVLAVPLFYGSFSSIGWLFVGLPAVFLLPLQTLRRLPWSLILLISAALGLAAFVPILLLLFHGQAITFRGTWWYWLLSVIASVAGFPTYCFLIRRRIHTAVAL